MNNSTPKKRGRPEGYRVDNPANKMLPVKVTQETLDRYKQAAKASGSNFSQWVRGALDDAVELQNN